MTISMLCLKTIEWQEGYIGTALSFRLRIGRYHTPTQLWFEIPTEEKLNQARVLDSNNHSTSSAHTY